MNAVRVCVCVCVCDRLIIRSQCYSLCVCVCVLTSCKLIRGPGFFFFRSPDYSTDDLRRHTYVYAFLNALPLRNVAQYTQELVNYGGIYEGMFENSSGFKVCARYGILSRNRREKEKKSNQIKREFTEP